MKRIISALIVLALCVCLVPAAFADMTQDEVEAYAAQSGVKGEFVTLDVLGLKIWLPDDLTAYDLPESVVEENGYVAYYTNNDQTSAVGITLNLFENQNLSREDVIGTLADSGIAKVEILTLNGLSCLAYTYEVQEGMDCYVISVMLGDGNVAEFAFTAGDDVFDAAQTVMTKSIMSAK